MRFRQIHLDFHTSEEIRPIGERFSKEQFQSMLRLGFVDSITLFSKCHHGWAYHPSEANETHPGLSFDLLGAMIEAAHEIGVKTPVYLSAGVDEKLVRRHPEWLVRTADGNTPGTQGYLAPGYHLLCLNSPYLDVLLGQIREVVERYEADGIFLDIVGVRSCYCHTCVNQALQEGKDPRIPEQMLELAERTYANYTRKVRETIDSVKPGLPVFHNGGHIRRGRRDLARMNTHLELESLPTGGYGYDHFPLSARYAQQLGMDFLGMTGKFHTWWGEFGGYKHPNALRYEVALSMANGARCSIGDQMDPGGHMDEATYRLVGTAYAEAAAKEKWCTDTTNVADVGLLSVEAIGYRGGEDEPGFKAAKSDAGAVRMLLEGHVLFDVIDAEADFGNYKVIVLPDMVRVSGELETKLRDYLARGGKLLASGESGLNEEGTAFAIDLGARLIGKNTYSPDYFRPEFPLPALGRAAFVMYSAGQKIELAEGGLSLGKRENPYFNREAFSFCSHQHAPNSGESGGSGMTESGCGIYIAWNIFAEYATMGSLHLKETVLHAIERLLPEKTLRTNLPAQGIVTLQKQTAEKRLINHWLYAVPVKRGDNIEVIEDIVPLSGIRAEVRAGGDIARVYMAPQMQDIPFSTSDGVTRYEVPNLECHQMVVLEWA